jgi:hypothetical protein
VKDKLPPYHLAVEQAFGAAVPPSGEAPSLVERLYNHEPTIALCYEAGARITELEAREAKIRALRSPPWATLDYGSALDAVLRILDGGEPNDHRGPMVVTPERQTALDAMWNADSIVPDS